jgi:prevent-host-death family protein
MEKTIGAFEIRRKFGQILQSVMGGGDKFIIHWHGQPVAAVVPMSVYEQWKKNRALFFEELRNAQARADLTPEEADEVAQEAIQMIRSQKAKP